MEVDLFIIDDSTMKSWLEESRATKYLESQVGLKTNKKMQLSLEWKQAVYVNEEGNF